MRIRKCNHGKGVEHEKDFTKEKRLGVMQGGYNITNIR